MNEAIIWLGPAPARQHGRERDDSARDARADCHAFVAAIRQVCGREPDGARLVVQAQEHQSGLCYAVACVYDSDDEWACAYAARVDADASAAWEQAGVTATQRAGRGR
jgi:hypothetical protein